MPDQLEAGAVSLRDRVAVVTGASRGIGRATALALAREGAHVVCAARTADASRADLPGTIEETVREIENEGGSALAVACDLMQERDIETLAERTITRFGRIDVLVNNAAINVFAPFTETTLKRWDLVLGVNLRGTALCTQAFLPQMTRQGGGRVINLSSGAVTDPEITAELGITPYAVSKAAIESLTASLALELRTKRIAVNCLRVETTVATEGARLMNPEADASNWETPEAVADALVWLATRENDYTGRVPTLADVRAAR